VNPATKRCLGIAADAAEDLRRNRSVPVTASREIDLVERAFEAAKRRAAVACAEAAMAVDQLLMMYADELEHDDPTSRILGPFPAEAAKVEKAIWSLP
jgi:hypothetical protein